MRNIYTYIGSIVILIAFLIACTDDYFQDETNLRVYIPEIESKSIEDLHLFLYDSQGKLVKRRVCTYPFEEEKFIRQGIIRFNVPPGDYNLTCFANTKNDSTSLDIVVEDEQDKSFISLEKIQDNKHKTAPPLRKILRKQTKVVPIGVSTDLDTVNISEDQVHVGTLRYIFKGLPSKVQNIEVHVQGLSSRLYFDGRESRNDTDNCIVCMSATRVDKKLPYSFEDFYFPSITNSNDKIALVVNFTDNKGIIIGSYSGELNVVDLDGNPVEAILKSGQTLNILFDGFILSSVSLGDWGDIDTGEITPM